MDRKRLTPLATKVLDAAQGIVASIVAVSGNVDEGNDRIVAGAFTKTIRERGGRLRVLDAHNTNSLRDIIGKPIKVEEVGRDALPPEVLAAYPDATGGLYTETQFLLDTPEGKGTFQRIEGGAAFEWSIGYDAIAVDYSEAMRDGQKVRVRDIKEIRLWEYSPVIWGMNPATATLSVKDRKEMVDVAAGIEYPVQRLADVLYGATRCAYMTLVDSWLVQGVLSKDEHAGLITLGDEHFTHVINGIAPEIGERQVCYYGANGWMAAEDPGEVKAGRVLSGTNAAAIVSALTTLEEVLRRAGVYDDEEDEDKAAAGPPEGEGTPTDTDLINRIKAAQLDIELMELAEVN